MGSEAPSLSENEDLENHKFDRSISTSDEFGISSASSGEQQKQASSAASDSSSSQQQFCSSAPERKVSTEDPTAIIESLRARLLSERNSSKSAKQQAAQLARKVKELERQLQDEIQRRKHCEDVIQELLGKLDSPESSEEQDHRKPKWISLRRRRDSSDGSVEGDALNQDTGSPSCSPISDTSAAAAARRIGRSCRTFKRKEIWELEIDEQVKGSWKKIGSDIVELCKMKEQESLGTETGWVRRAVEIFESKNEFWAPSSPCGDQEDLNSKISKNKNRNSGDSDDHSDSQERAIEYVAAKNLISEAGSSSIDSNADEKSGEVSNASLQEASISASNVGSRSPDDLGSPIKDNEDDSAAAQVLVDSADSVGAEGIPPSIAQESPRSEEPSEVPAPIVQETPRSEEPSIVQEPLKSEEPSKVPASIVVQEPPKSEELPKSLPASSSSEIQEQAPTQGDRIQYAADPIQQSQYPLNRFQHRHSFGNAYSSFSDRQDNVQEILRALRIAKQQLAANQIVPGFPPAIFHGDLQIQSRYNSNNNGFVTRPLAQFIPAAAAPEILEAQNSAYSFDSRFVAPNRF